MTPDDDYDSDDDVTKCFAEAYRAIRERVAAGGPGWNPKEVVVLTAERLREVLAYDPETGLFTWLVSRGGSQIIGAVAGHRHRRRGYRRIKIDQRLYGAHRLAWLYVHGAWPDNEIDHINGIPGDDRIVNLRAATRTENVRNSRPPRTNSTGFKGVYRHYYDPSRFIARIGYNGGHEHLGVFDSAEDAHKAYQDAAKRLFGQFARFA